MNLVGLYNVAENKGINVIDFRMNNKAIIGNCNGHCVIGLDYSQIHSYIEEKELLAEEIGHSQYDAYYPLSANKDYIDKQEYKAKKWKIQNICPLQSILDCFKRHVDNLYEISEELSVSPSTLQFAIEYYKDNGLL